MKTTTHRGRTKQNKIAIQIRLSKDEIERLDKLADKNCRSRTMQATHMILKGLR
jgi:predicted transcriptional regulator